MNKDDQILPRASIMLPSMSNYWQQKKMKTESDSKSNVILKPVQNIKENVSYLYPSISVEVI